MPSDKNSSNDITIPQKYLDKIVKMQQDQDKGRQEEYALLREHLSQMSKLIDELVKVTATGSTVAATKKIIPFQTGSQLAGQFIIPPSNDTPPPNPDQYPTQINIYQQNDNKPIQHMTVINDGPGDIFFVVGYSETNVNRREGRLNVNDQRELFNVYQIRLRSTLPETTFRLVEGIFRTGSFSPFTKANVEIRPSVQANEILVLFDAIFDNAVPTITITSPTIQTLAANYNLKPSYRGPLPPGATATFVNSSTGLPMPFLIRSGFILEAFAFFGNTSTDCTLRIWAEPVVNSANFFGQQTFTLSSVLPFSNRGIPFNFVPNINFYSTQFLDPTGAPSVDLLGNPAPGRFALFTITNDDPFNNIIGNPFFVSILRRMS